MGSISETKERSFASYVLSPTNTRRIHIQKVSGGVYLIDSSCTLKIALKRSFVCFVTKHLHSTCSRISPLSHELSQGCLPLHPLHWCSSTNLQHIFCSFFSCAVVLDALVVAQRLLSIFWNFSWHHFFCIVSISCKISTTLLPVAPSITLVFLFLSPW